MAILVVSINISKKSIKSGARNYARRQIEREAVEEVYVENCYDLCRLCYKKFIDDPLKVLHEKSDNK